MRLAELTVDSCLWKWIEDKGIVVLWSGCGSDKRSTEQ
jgi:hypothetical protein